MLSVLVICTAMIQEVQAQTVPATNTVTTGTVKVPTGWTSFAGSTDVSSTTGWAGLIGYPWSGTVVVPPNGHTVWISGSSTENSGTTITGLTIGNSYNFTFYAAELRTSAAAGGVINDNYDGTLRLSNSTTNTTLGTYPFTGGSSNAWRTFTYTFTATETELPIAFQYLVNPNSNGNMWNVSFGSSAVVSLSTCNAGTTVPTLTATTKANVCPATTVDLTSITATNLPASTTLTWHTGTPATTANKITGTSVAAGTYYAAFFDATNNCYSGTSGSATTAVTATVTACSTPVTVGTPAVITGTTGTSVTGNPPTGVSGGTSPYTYSDGTADALCTAPTSPTLALPSGRITGLVAATGAHSINTVGLAAGTYQYCIKVCDATGTNCVVSKHTIVVTATATCNAGSAAPSLIKN
ncbi:hypothetical protein [Flectobacillus longus]|uniref:hypothetical protein n=1 Tax=Flectobacillus longus TaxID=2984207 RepID=UPI0024B86D97|nr:hypothetical protein [Flectobacillus longus]MDI9882791.1 hypothetical protein [Flectobacillus longus]